MPVLAVPMLFRSAAWHNKLCRHSAVYIISLTAALTTLVVAARMSLATADESPPLPLWPAIFSANFVSEYKATQGRYAVYFPASSAALILSGRGGVAASERIDMVDGTRDHLCSAYYNDTACTHLTTEGFRYIYFPEISDCCSYVTGSYDCGGPLGPNWVNNATGNLVYMGTQDVRGTLCHKWNVLGLGDPPHDNFYYQTVDSGMPCEIDADNYLRTPDQKADDQYIFDLDSFTTDVPSHTFHVPPVCHHARYCGPPVCSSTASREDVEAS